MSDQLKTYSVLIAWNDNDLDEGDYGATVRAADREDAEAKVRALMAEDDLYGEEDGEPREYGRLIECQEGAIWKAADLEKSLRDIIASSEANDGGSLMNAIETAKALIAEIDSY